MAADQRSMAKATWARAALRTQTQLRSWGLATLAEKLPTGKPRMMTQLLLLLAAAPDAPEGASRVLRRHSHPEESKASPSMRLGS